jgi:hypothetical protein
MEIVATVVRIVGVEFYSLKASDSAGFSFPPPR